MYFLVGIKSSFSNAIDVLDQDSSYDVLARIKRKEHKFAERIRSETLKKRK